MEGIEMKTPICPILLFFEGDEYKCNKSECNYDLIKKTCTMKCLKFQENIINKKIEKNLLTKHKK